jgi:pyrroloquinoline quinone (PQQ) biosynthesis protein C
MNTSIAGGEGTTNLREALPSVCAALDLGGRAQDAASLFDAMTGPQSSIAVTLGARGAEVRVLATPPSTDAGRALLRRLSERYALALDPLERVADLFEGGEPMQIGAVIAGSAPPRFEVVLDAQAQGPWKAAALAEEALVRLGFGHAWPSMAEQALRRGYYLDQVVRVLVDLGGPRGDARPPVELHVRHHEASLDEVRAALAGSPLAARAEEILLALTGSIGPFRAGPLVSRHAFVEPGAREPSSRALEIPAAAYGPTDAVTRGRVLAYLALHELPFDAYARALAASAPGPLAPLAAAAGLQRRVCVREDAAGLALTVELSSDASAPAPAIALAKSLPPPSEIARRFENDIVLADHPFMRRVAREPLQIGVLWLMIANFWEGIVQDFPARLGQVIAKIDDDRVRCIVAKQLHDELGEGVFARAHKAMFRRLREAVEPFRLPGSDDVLLAPGRAFGRALWADLATERPYVTLGKMMMIETYGEQTDRFMGGQFRRQDRIDTRSLEWLHLHEGLEIDHAQDSHTLTQLVPDDPESIADVWQGAEAIVTAGRHYFNAFYRICYG